MTMVLNESGGDVAIVAAGETKASSVAWGAVIAGAVAAAAISLLLLLLGSGLGLAVVSPWSANNPSIAAVGAWALVWLIVVHWVGSAVGGYLAGRLRGGWTGLHRDEVTFRDTAHGFLAWGVAVLLVAGLSGIAASTVLLSGVQAVATVTGGAAQGAAQGATQNATSGSSLADPTAYFVDTLFRSAPGTTAPAAAAGATAPVAGAATGSAGQGPVTADTRAEVGRIVVRDIAADQFPADDQTYLADLVAARTGMSPDAARMRVSSVVASLEDAKAKAKDAADNARKAAATASLGLVLALLIGAFVASVAAALGGHLRDDPTA